MDLIETLRTNSSKKFTSTISTPTKHWRSAVDRFEDEFGFFKLWLKNPKALGAVLPTSKVTADRMADVARIGEDKHVLELGPGSGIITRSLLARGIASKNLHLVEFTSEFVETLRQNYHGVNVMEGDAFYLDKVISGHFSGKFDTIVSGLPLLNFTLRQRIQLLNKALDLLEPGRPFVQFSYGWRPPIPPRSGPYSVELLDWVFRNIPPAKVWIYRRITD